MDEQNNFQYKKTTILKLQRKIPQNEYAKVEDWSGLGWDV